MNKKQAALRFFFFDKGTEARFYHIKYFFDLRNPSQDKEVTLMYVTYGDLFSFVIMMTAVLSFVVMFIDRKKK